MKILAVFKCNISHYNVQKMLQQTWIYVEQATLTESSCEFR